MKFKILLVDDDIYVLDSVTAIVKTFNYDVSKTDNPLEALEIFKRDRHDVVISDIKMPQMSGIELLEELHKLSPETPVILMTAYAEIELAVQAIKKGAFDFILKPFYAEDIRRSLNKAERQISLVSIEKNYKKILEEEVIRKTTQLRQTMELLENASKEIISRLIIASEYRDDDTGSHIKRIGLYAQELALALGCDEKFVKAISFASPMHDIGKVGIPDSILLKQGKLTPEEFEIMKTHTTIGAKILSGSNYEYIKLAESIALTHHERYDGTGYPKGLKGEEIPLEGRIVIIIDQYDALRSKRPYKKGFTHEQTFEIITKGDGRTLPSFFDPEVLNAFIKINKKFDEIFVSNQE